MRKIYPVLALIGILGACSSVGFVDKNVYVLDPPNQNLRAHDPKDDRPLHDCDPVHLAGGGFRYPCVAHFVPDYQALLDEINRLEKELEACQQNNGRS